MKTSLNSKNILSLQDISASEISSILSLASEFKKNKRKKEFSKLLNGKILGMIFQKPSTRTRVSFESAMIQMGGCAISLNSSDIQLSRGESVDDTARTLSLYLNCLMARVYDHSDIEKLAINSSIPVINGLSNLFHPCQILADLFTIKEHKRKFKNINLAWIGDGNNVCNDMLLGCSKTGINITVASPKGYEPPSWIIQIAKNNSLISNCTVSIVNDPINAINDADVVVTDTFMSIGMEQEKIEREQIFLPKYQVNSDLMKFAKSDAIFMHCLPAKRGQEVTSDIIDGSSSVVWNEAENRLHVQKAILTMLIKEK